MNLDQLRIRVIDEFTPHWALNDGAHRIGHFAEVEACANEINRRLDLRHDPVLIMLAAYFHDLFAWSRENHEQLSWMYTWTTDHRIFVELDKAIPGGREMVAYACLEHRASYKGGFTNGFSALVSSGDRGFPGAVEKMVERSMRYHVDKLKVTDSVECRERAIKHIKEKFGTGGYARYPDLYFRAFGEELAAQRLEIDAL